MTIAHRHGSTEIRTAPERVVAVGFNDQDFTLALGITPVGVRQLQGGIDITDRPWAQDALDGAEPELIGAEEVDFERVAGLAPDLILGLYSSLTEDEYETLADIAPTVAQSDDLPDFGTPWPEQMRLTGRALGREGEAEAIVASIEERFAAARAEHPELQGLSLAFASGSTGEFFVYGSQDLRARVFTDLGFETPAEIDVLAGESFFAELSRERLDLLDADVLVIYGSREQIAAEPVPARLDVVTQGRTISLDPAGDLANAIGFSSPLSLPFAIDLALPRLVAAADGDPATAVEPLP